jgi:tetratricopeptide (TPR) repeat protein
MSRNVLKLFGSLLALSVLVAACGGGGKGDVATHITDLRESDAGDVDPPEAVAADAFGLPGLIVSTNSRSWRDLVKSPAGTGAVILFVQPGGPSDRKALARGDLITAIDGEAVASADYALTLLRGKPGQTKKVTLMGRNGKDREIEVKLEKPKASAKPFLDGMISGSPRDAVLRYVRAAAGGTSKDYKVSHQAQDLKIALEEEPRFVEALSLQGNLVYNQRLGTKDRDKQVRIIGEALASWANALDIDPRHTETLALQSGALLALGKVDQAKADAERAVNVDGSSAGANYALARAELALKKPQNAAGPAAAAVAANPYTNLTYYRTLATVFKQLKRKADCSKTLLSVVPHLKGSGSPALAKEATQLEKEAKENCG